MTDVWGGFLRLNVVDNVLVEVTHEATRLRTDDLSVYNELIYPINEKGGINDATYFNDHFYIASKTNGGLKIPLNNKESIETISPNCPLSNNISSVNINKKDLWLTFGGYGPVMNPYSPYGLTQYGISTYKNMQSWQHISYQQLQQFKSTVNISFNPQKTNLVYISSFHDGIGIWDTDKNELVIYNSENTNALEAIAENDTRVYGVAFDRNGTGWLTNTAENPYLISIDKNNQFYKT